ncbi:MAG: MoaD/ThiS family protein [Burkholderiaceae bacterium]|nr:MoaD/ThiS family protein [Burkholderiaceae bacterium]
MPRLIFTQQLRRFTEVPEIDSDALTLRQALEDAFAVNAALRGYVLDDQRQLRPHLAVFVDGRRLRGKGADALDVALPSDATVYVLQALSGG